VVTAKIDDMIDRLFQGLHQLHLFCFAKQSAQCKEPDRPSQQVAAADYADIGPSANLGMRGGQSAVVEWDVFQQEWAHGVSIID